MQRGIVLHAASAAPLRAWSAGDDTGPMDERARARGTDPAPLGVPGPPLRTDTDAADDLRAPQYEPQRHSWPGVTAAALLVAVIAGVLFVHRDDTAPVAAPSAAQPSPVGSPEQAAADRAITAAVKAALTADPSLAVAPIDVRTREGVVTLEGPAPDDAARRRAEVLAAAPPGVRGVDNRLVVRPASAS